MKTELLDTHGNVIGWQESEFNVGSPASPSDIASYRWKVENGGVSVTVSSGTYRFDSTRENRVSWVVLAGIAQSNPSFTQKWKTLEGVFITLTSSDILIIYQTIFAHISACFAKEAELLGRSELPLLEKLEEEFKELL